MQKNYSWNPITCICENGKNLKRIADTSVITCNEVIYAMDIVSTNVSIISANVTISMLKNSDDKKVRYKIDCYILSTVLLVIMLLFIITIICYHYAKHRSKLKNLLLC